jgi:hypothetical protein
MIKIFTDTFKSESKTIEYIQSRLRSATDIYKHGVMLRWYIKINDLGCIFIPQQKNISGCFECGE